VKQAEARVTNFRNRIDQRKAENYGFASLAAVPYAHIVADLLQKKKPKGTSITLAPNPKDIVSAISYTLPIIGLNTWNRFGRTSESLAPPFPARERWVSSGWHSFLS
jgi:hypothetical protein